MMKKIMLVLLVLLLVLGLVACAAPAPTETTSPEASASMKTPESTAKPASEPVVVFTDAVLEEWVRKAMDKPEGDITVAEAEAVEGFDFRVEDPGSASPRIKDISALKYFKNLKSLDLSYHLVEDLSPLTAMKNLEAFYYFDARSVKDFSALAELTNMLDLIIHSDTFSDADMQYLAGMTNIELLWIRGGEKLTDISVVANFKKLYRLNIEHSGVTDISAAAGITSLVEMSLRGSQVSDVSPLRDLVNLRALYLEGCPVTDYSSLSGIYPNLTDKDFELN